MNSKKPWSVYRSYHAYSLFTPRPSARAWLLPLCAVILLTKGWIASPRDVLEIRVVPTESMRPTLYRNGLVVVNQLSSTPKRGNIVALYLPEPSLSEKSKSEQAFFSRVIGLPGDTVEITDKHVIVNSQPLTETYLNELNWPTSDDWERGAKTVPDSHYYVLGDNRLISFDSNAFGFLPEEDILGHVLLTFDFPLWPRAVQ